MYAKIWIQSQSLLVNNKFYFRDVSSAVVSCELKCQVLRDVPRKFIMRGRQFAWNDVGNDDDVDDALTSSLTTCEIASDRERIRLTPEIHSFKFQNSITHHANYEIRSCTAETWLFNFIYSHLTNVCASVQSFCTLVICGGNQLWYYSISDWIFIAIQFDTAHSKQQTANTCIRHHINKPHNMLRLAILVGRKKLTLEHSVLLLVMDSFLICSEVRLNSCAYEVNEPSMYL